MRVTFAALAVAGALLIPASAAPACGAPLANPHF
jgi:hypothetical protein